jgi:hypothetical protein
MEKIFLIFSFLSIRHVGKVILEMGQSGDWVHRALMLIVSWDTILVLATFINACVNLSINQCVNVSIDHGKSFFLSFPFDMWAR